MSITSSIYIGFYYLCLPVYIALLTVSSWILLLLSPVIHVAHYVLHATVIVPFQLLSRFESVYIFLGVAAVIGVITGSVLHLSSTVMMAAMNLQSTNSIEAEGKISQSKADGKRSRRIRKSQSLSENGLNDLNKDYREWLDKDRGVKGKGLVSQTILEEDDSSDDGF